MGATPPGGNEQVVGKAQPAPRSLAERVREKVSRDTLEEARVRALLDSSSESEEDEAKREEEGDNGHSLPVISTERSNYFPVGCFDKGEPFNNPPVQAYETISGESSGQEDSVMTG